jgi:glutamine amidotransferase
VIAIVDYGVGNIRSVERALARVGAEPKLTADPDDLAKADGVVLPGVGAFSAAIDKLSERGLGRQIVDLAKKGKPLLGVCLGYQLLFDESEEHGHHKGLGLLPGKVVKVESSARLPVIGWCRLQQSVDSMLWSGIKDGSYFYFVHSYTPSASDSAIAWTEHSPVAAGARGNVMGTQFHPEKSGPDGLRVYKNFVTYCS